MFTAVAVRNERRLTSSNLIDVDQIQPLPAFAHLELCAAAAQERLVLASPQFGPHRPQAGEHSPRQLRVRLPALVTARQRQKKEGAQGHRHPLDRLW